MSSTYSSNLRVELIGSGDQAGTWGATTDNNFAYIFDAAIAGYQVVTVTSTAQALTYVNGPTSTANLNQSVYAILKFNSASAATAIYAPPASKQYIIWNNSGYTITIYNSTVIGNTTAAGTGVAILNGNKVMVWSDGTNFYEVQAQNLTGTLPIANGGTGQVTANAAFNALAPAQTANRLLKSDGTNTSFAQAVLTTDVTGTLPVANGGTGVTTAAAITALVGNLLFPIGAIYTATVATNPGTLFGFGTWTAFSAGRVMIGNGGGFSAGATGGSADAVVVSHTHTATSTDSGHTHTVNAGTNTSNSLNSGGTVNLASSTTSTGFANITTTIASAGVSGTNANLQPYIVVYMWQRTA
jgi:hypothetical protein